MMSPVDGFIFGLNIFKASVLVGKKGYTMGLNFRKKINLISTRKNYREEKKWSRKVTGWLFPKFEKNKRSKL